MPCRWLCHLSSNLLSSPCASVQFQKVFGRNDAEGARRAAEVSEKLNKLPLQHFCTREQLMGKSLAQLKVCVRKFQLTDADLVDMLSVQIGLVYVGQLHFAYGCGTSCGSRM